MPPQRPGVTDEEQFTNTKAQPETELAEVKHHDIKPRVAKEDDEVTKQLLKDAEPTWITDQMIKRPLTIVCLGFTLMLCGSIIAISNGYFEFTQANERDYLIWDHEITLESDMRVLAEGYIKANTGDGSSQKGLRLTKESNWNPVLVFSSKNGESLLEKKNLLKVQQIEQEFQAQPGWTDLCLATSIDDTSCSPSAFASSLSFLGSEDLSDMPQAQIDQTWKGVTSNPAAFVKLSPFFQALDRVEEDDGKLSHMRAFISYGFPIQVGEKRYEDIYEDMEDQHRVALDFSQAVIDVFEKYDDDPDIQVSLVAQDIIKDTMNDYANNDMMWTSGAMLFVYVYFCYQLKSIILGCAGITIILLSLPLTQFINKGILRNDFYSSLNILVIFIILGIGADNIFVFMDGWKQSAAMDSIKDDKRKRIAFAVKRAARATATTSGTTSVAFFANFFSSIMPFQAFGLFATIIIIVNYCYILLIFPPLAFWHEANFEKSGCCGQNTSESKLRQVSSSQHTEPSDDNSEAKEFGPVEKFFAGPWNNTVRTYKYPIICCFCLFSIVSLVTALQLSPLSEAEEYLPPDDKLMVISNIMREEFNTGTFTHTIEIYWGIKGINKDKVTTWDSSYAGEAIMDEEFEFSSVEEQQSLLDLCEDLTSQEFVLNGDVSCWTAAFNKYLATKSLAMPIQDPEQFKEELFAWTTSTSEGKQAVSQNQVGFIGEELRYMKIEATSSADPSLSADQKQTTYDQWKEYIVSYREDAPEALKSANIYGGKPWNLIPVEKAFLSSAFKGMAIAGIFAFIVLLIATGNIIQACISLLCVTVINVGVLAVMKLNGWEIGVSESIGMVILIGFSVDYCVHLSADYMHSAHHTRSEKMQQAYAEMGVSILSGAITTCGSGVFLFGGQVTMFPKFAILILSTIILSFFTSMCLFGALMHVLGPEKEFGNINALCKSQKK